VRTSSASLCLALAASALLAAGCASNSTQPAGKAAAAEPAPASAAPASGGKVVKSRDGSFEGEVIGTPAPGSKFAKLAIGMRMAEVQTVMTRAPDRSHTYESGKRWIPFYFGNDARRMQALYAGEGCLIFTDGNVWGGAGGDLIQIHVDTSGACYQP
jgi:hypothetical protein